MEGFKDFNALLAMMQQPAGPNPLEGLIAGVGQAIGAAVGKKANTHDELLAGFMNIMNGKAPSSCASGKCSGGESCPTGTCGNKPKTGGIDLGGCANGQCKIGR